MNTTVTREKQAPTFEELYDFPMSWDWHRFYCREEMRDDPGPNFTKEDEDDNYSNNHDQA